MNELLDLFRKEGVEFQLYEHEPVHTSLEASRVRGVDLKTGVKSLVLKSDDGRYVLADLAADRKVDIKRLESAANVGKLHFATREEVVSVTGCEPGSVHPFGRLFGLPTYLDPSVLENENVNFNIGLLTRSVRIRREDLTRLLNAVLVVFAKN